MAMSYGFTHCVIFPTLLLLLLLFFLYLSPANQSVSTYFSPVRNTNCHSTQVLPSISLETLKSSLHVSLHQTNSSSIQINKVRKYCSYLFGSSLRFDI